MVGKMVFRERILTSLSLEEVAAGSYRHIPTNSKRVYRGGASIPRRRLLTLVRTLNCLAESSFSKGPFFFGGLPHRLGLVVTNAQVSPMFNE